MTLSATLEELERAASLTESEVWSRPALTPRRRSLLTIGILTAQYEPGQLESGVRLALENGVDPDEIHEALFHAGLYRGMPAWRCAVSVTNRVLHERGLLDAGGEARDPLTQDEREAARDRVVEALHLTRSSRPQIAVEEEILDLQSLYALGDIWSRPGLSYEDRCLITLAVLTALRQPPRLREAVRTALRAGLDPEQVFDALAHAGVYAGVTAWRSAASVAREVIGS
jgi:4-carboxymuconolactone decarboxylase